MLDIQKTKEYIPFSMGENDRRWAGFASETRLEKDTSKTVAEFTERIGKLAKKKDVVVELASDCEFDDIPPENIKIFPDGVVICEFDPDDYEDFTKGRTGSYPVQFYVIKEGFVFTYECESRDQREEPTEDFEDSY